MNLKLLIPNFDWLPRIKHYGVSGDISAGITGALLAFPQAIALAALAGMPPVYGIYASIIPLVVAAVWGSSWHAIGGTNTAMAMLMIAAVSTVADPLSNQYIAIVLVLTIVTGLIQLFIGLLGFGRLLDFISSTVITTLTMAVSLSIMIAVLPKTLGSSGDFSGTFIRRLIQLPEMISSMDWSIALLSLFTLLFGFIGRVFLPKFSFILALVAGTSLFWLLKSFSPDVFRSAEMLESVSFDLFSFAVPDYSLIPLDENSILHFFISALSLALLGMTQAVVISRSLALSSGQRIDVNKEITGQGLSNIAAGFFSGFAVSSSFSSSATNHASGANTPLSAVVLSTLIILIGLLAANFLTIIPVAVISGGLMMIGLTMFKPQNFVIFRHPRHEFFIFLVTLITSLTFGLIGGVVSGVVLSALVYLWLTANPKIQIEEQIASDGRPIHIVNIEGSLFYGAVQRVESVLRQWTHRDGQPSTLIVRTDNLSYLDVPGVRLLVEEAERRIAEGGDFYLYVRRNNIYKQLENSHLLPLIGTGHIIRPNIDHPMNSILFPYQSNISKKFQGSLQRLKYPLVIKQDKDVQLLVRQCLKKLSVFSQLEDEKLRTLVNSSTLYSIDQNKKLVSNDSDLEDFLVLVEGQLLLEQAKSDEQNQYTKKINVGEEQSVISPYLAKNDNQLTALKDSYYILLSPEKMDFIINSLTIIDEEVVSKEQKGSILDLVEPKTLELINAKLVRKKVKSRQTLVRQGDSSNEFYIIFSGHAEVIRHNLLDGNRHVIATLVDGDSFGEEALLQEISRNADVTMISDGEVGILSKNDFNTLLRPLMAPSIEKDNAIKLIKSGVARWLDCRFEPEYINGTLPNALLMPLTKVREAASSLDDDITYIAYCNNGRRSQAVTFLLRVQSKQVIYLEGGLDATDMFEAFTEKQR